MSRIRLFVVLVAVAVLAVVPSCAGATSTIVVSQVFAGGGNAGATYTNDFVELFNRGSAAVDLTGWTTPVCIRVLDELAGDRALRLDRPGSVLPRATRLDCVGRSPVADAPTPPERRTSRAPGGKVALARDDDVLTCGASAGSCAARRSSRISSATARQPTTRARAPAPALSNTTAARPRRRPGAPTRTRTRRTSLPSRRLRATGSRRRPVCAGGSTPSAVDERSRRRRRSTGALDLARAFERELRKRRLGEHAVADLRAGDGRQQQRRRATR